MHYYYCCCTWPINTQSTSAKWDSNSIRHNTYIKTRNLLQIPQCNYLSSNSSPWLSRLHKSRQRQSQLRWAKMACHSHQMRSRPLKATPLSFTSTHCTASTQAPLLSHALLPLRGDLDLDPCPRMTTFVPAPAQSNSFTLANCT